MTGTDSTGHVFVEVDNVRITYVPSRDRTAAANWAGSDVIRVQAKKGHGDALHMGAEFPVADEMAFVRLIEGICQVYREGRGAVVASQ